MEQCPQLVLRAYDAWARRECFYIFKYIYIFFQFNDGIQMQLVKNQLKMQYILRAYDACTIMEFKRI